MNGHGHDHVGELLDRYRTGELDEPDRLRVEGHLEACAGCRSELDALVAFARTVERGYTAERVARAAEREPDWARLRASIVSRTSARAPGGRRAGLGRYVPQAALAVLALVAVGVLWEQGVRGPEEAERTLRSERPAATPGPGREEGSRGEDRFAEAGGAATETRTDGAPASPDEIDDRRREVGLADGRFRDDVDSVEGEAERVGAEARVEVAENRADAVAPAAGAQQRDETVEGLDTDRAAAQAPEELGKAAAAPPADLERFQRSARSALAQADTLLAARALAQWRDSLAPGRDLPPELERAAQALADSLAAFLANRP
ncbi:MAG TPA: zf-HC2 domain-containing protein [Gemmatimonadota bacterium]|nr:zf-HC2 domain-containing protein [Gemmatimonadota bacterium]